MCGYPEAVMGGFRGGFGGEEVPNLMNYYDFRRFHRGRHYLRLRIQWYCEPWGLWEEDQERDWKNHGIVIEEDNRVGEGAFDLVQRTLWVRHEVDHGTCWGILLLPSWRRFVR
jgi:hypothetical protein